MSQANNALNALQKMQDAAAYNISSSTINGHKELQIVFETADDKKTDGTNHFDKVMQSVLPETQQHINFRPGPIAITENPTDIAIKSPKGFYKLKSTTGQTIYTRDGEFHFNDKRKLVDKHGNELQGSSGSITKNANGGELRIGSNGRLSQNNVTIGQLEIVDIADKKSLIAVQGGFMVSPDKQASEEKVDKAVFVSGALEKSNISPMKSMVDLINISRSIDHNTRVIQSLDEAKGKANQYLNPTV